MKNLLNKISDLSRTSLQDVKKFLNICRLTTLMGYIENLDEEGNSFIEIPSFGKIKVSSEMDFEFIPTTELKKEVFSIKQNPNTFLKNELRKVFQIEDK